MVSSIATGNTKNITTAVDKTGVRETSSMMFKIPENIV
jgi:hypothetical protein